MDLKAILKALSEGRTFWVSNHLHTTKIQQKHVDRWKDAGRELLTEGKDGHLYMASGKGRVDIAYCRLTIQ